MKKLRFPILLKVILAGLLVSLVASGVAVAISYTNQLKTAKQTMENKISSSISNLENYYNNEDNISYLSDVKEHVKGLYDDRVSNGTEYELNDPRFHNNFSEFEEYYMELDGLIYDNGFGFYPEKAEFQAKYHTITSALTSSKITSDTIATYCAYLDGNRIVFLSDSRQIEYEGKENAPFYHLAGTFFEFKEGEQIPATLNQTVRIYDKTCRVFPIYSSTAKTEIMSFIFIEYDEGLVIAQVNKTFNSEIIILLSTALAIVLVYALISYFLFVKNINKLSKASLDISKKLHSKSLKEPTQIKIRSHDEMQNLATSLDTLQSAVYNYAELVKKEANEREKINAELEVASKIQLETLPPLSYLDRKVSLKSYIKTAKEVGGDFYDYFYIDENRFAVLIADVSGKGIPAALFMMRSKEILKSELLSNKPLDEALYEANNTLVMNNKENLFVTAFVGVIDLKKNEITFVNAGHEKPYILSKGKVHKLEGTSNFVIGELDNFQYEVEKAKFNQDDILFMFTDGLNESINKDKEEFGYERIEELLVRNANGSLDELIEAINTNHVEFVGKELQFDDITMMAIKANSNKLHLSFDKKDFSIIEEATNRFFKEYSFLDETTKSHVGIVLDELLNNQISYEKREDLKIELDFSYDEKALELTLTSNGEKFNPFIDVKKKSSKDEAIGGHGINIVKNITKNQKYAYKNNQSIITVVF